MTLKCPYTYPLRSRAAKANYICGIGGYSGRHEHWPVEFSVYAGHADLDFDTLWKRCREQGEFPFDWDAITPAEGKAYYDLSKELYEQHKDHLWAWAVEDAARNLHEDDFYRTLWAGPEISVKFCQMGRGGKHLVLEEFEGHTLSGQTPEDLYIEMMSQYDENAAGSYLYSADSERDTLKKGWVWTYWTEKDITLLYKYVRQCEVDFSSERIKEAVESAATSVLFSNIVNQEWENVKKAMASHEDAVAAARLVGVSFSIDSLLNTEVAEAFLTLCNAAGVSQEELDNGKD